ncbi:unnamed protein product [Cuscuta epithymum]|uniref:Uncharacterized protein n=1 Tax=Cuscuta epithymum TaxID=186058 RepID=A0AAV0DYI9_9ASTE|nr:unnamed protein product [Cuscuta epithymum]
MGSITRNNRLVVVVLVFALVLSREEVQADSPCTRACPTQCLLHKSQNPTACYSSCLHHCSQGKNHQAIDVIGQKGDEHVESFSEAEAPVVVDTAGTARSL